jgi:hypothetical protein
MDTTRQESSDLSDQSSKLQLAKGTSSETDDVIENILFTLKCMLDF